MAKQIKSYKPRILELLNAVEILDIKIAELKKKKEKFEKRKSK
jgi:hypothetical protein